MGNCCKYIKRSKYRKERSTEFTDNKSTSVVSNHHSNAGANVSSSSIVNTNPSISNNNNNSSTHSNIRRKSANSQSTKSNSNSAQQQHPYLHHGRMDDSSRLEDANASVPHIADFYPEDADGVPADNPITGTLFLPKANVDKRKSKLNQSESYNTIAPDGSGNQHKRANSCSTIYVDDSTVSQPNLKSAIKLVSFAIHYHIKRRTSDRSLGIFDEKLYPLTKDTQTPSNYDTIVPEQRVIYKFMKNLFTSAQLTAECAIVTLIYLERVLTYAEIDLCPANWRRLLLGAILLASKVWDDQAVWNVDYCQILKDVNVENMNELERQYLNLLQFNINVPSSVYAKYYFDLRTLAEDNNLTFPHEQLTKEKALKLEALSSLCEEKCREAVQSSLSALRRTASADNIYIQSRKSLVIIS